jgi:type II secretion system protein H
MRINPTKKSRGFTLIELILVMTLLIIVVSLVTPLLGKFFQGRSLDSELRQFVSLTHFAQSRAVSEGTPMLLWVDTRTQTYGLTDESGYQDDEKAVQYTMADGLKIGVGRLGAKASSGAKHVGIHFSPDGLVITNTSVSGVSMQEGNNKPVWIMPAANGLSYEVQH